VLAVVGCSILTETYHPVLQKRAKPSSSSKTNAQDPSVQSSPIKRLSAQLITIFRGPWMRPAHMLIHSPIVLLFAIYTTITQGYLLLVFATLGLMYQDHYHFTPGASGLAYLGLATGLTISQFTLGHLSDKHIAHVARLNNGTHKPEDRLPPLIIGALIIPVSLLAYGWGTHTHWIVPILATALFAIGYMCTYLPVMMYLIDTYTQYAASAIAACTVLRSICSAILPLAADPLYRRLGYDWGNSLLGLIALVFFPAALVLQLYGERIRLRFEVKLDGA
jgi:MFS family permease